MLFVLHVVQRLLTFDLPCLSDLDYSENALVVLHVMAVVAISYTVSV